MNQDSMKAFRTIALAVLALLGFLLPHALAQPNDTTRNAADLYRQAAQQLKGSLTEQELEAMAVASRKDGDLSQAQLGLLKKAQEALATAHEAAQLKQVDWAVDLSAGPDAAMPWLMDIRQLMYAAAVDARAKAAEGNASAAVERLLDLRAMSRHAAQDLVAVNYLVYVGGDLLAIQTATLVLPEVAEEQVQDFRQGINSLPRRPALGDAVRVEAAMWEDWLRSEPDAPAKLVTRVQALVADDDEAAAKIMEQSQLKQQYRDDWSRNKARLINGVSDTFDAAEVIAKLPPREREPHFERWSAALEQMNWLVPIVVPSFDRVAEADYRHAVQAALLEAAVAVMLEGEGALEAHPDPATGEPFKYEEQGEGFVLTSEKEMDGQPIRLEMQSSAG